MSQNPKIIFFGTPEIAAASLEAIIRSQKYDVAAVFTQPDKPVGRGKHLAYSPVKEVALRHNVPIFQPKSLKQEKISDELKNILDEKIDLAIVIAYGKIIPPYLLAWPTLGMVNVHVSLLPHLRGAAPIHRAVFNGDQETGISLMQLDEGLDTGAVFFQERLPIEKDENFGQLYSKITLLAKKVLLENLPLIINKTLVATPQAEIGISYAQKWEDEELNINWSEPADVTHRRVLTSSPDLGARTSYQGKLLKIFQTKVISKSPEDYLYSTYLEHPKSLGVKVPLPGEIVYLSKNECLVATGDNKIISIEELQFPGKKKISIKEALNGRLLSLGAQFT